MKKILCLTCLFCCVLFMQAQTYKSRNTQSAKAVAERLESLVDQFCKYVETIGSTHSVSEAEKNRLRREKVPELFYRYQDRRMVTTAGSTGAIKSSKKMSDYFVRLQRQASNDAQRKKLSDQRVTYDLSFIFACTDGELQWTESGSYADGTKEYETTILIYQTYLKETLNGVETVRSRRETDKKEMIAKKLVLPNGNELVKLGDITGAERLETENK